jgi:hypothetical protein
MEEMALVTSEMYSAVSWEQQYVPKNKYAIED